MARAIVLILRSGPWDRVSKDAPSQSNRKMVWNQISLIETTFFVIPANAGMTGKMCLNFSVSDPNGRPGPTPAYSAPN